MLFMATRTITKSPARLQRFVGSVPIPPECSLWDLINEKTGLELSEEQLAAWDKRTDGERQQKLMTLRALGQLGRNAERPEVNAVWRIGLMSGYAEPVWKTPRWNCLPWVARSKRQGLAINLAYYLHYTPGCRHLRVTLGHRIPLGCLRASFQKLSKSISRLNTRPWFRKQVEIILRSCELTWNEADAHVHAHLLVKPRKRLSASNWVRLQEQVRRHFGADIGTFESIGEVGRTVPYFTKPSDLEDFGGDDIKTLAEQTRHLRTHEPLGEFRAFCRRLQDRKMTLVRRHDCIAMVSRSDGARQRTGRKDRKASTIEVPRNQLLHIGHPRPHGTARLEPTLLVRGYTGDLNELLANYPNLLDLHDQLMPQWPRRPRSTQGPPNKVPYIDHIIDHLPSLQPPTPDFNFPITFPSNRSDEDDNCDVAHARRAPLSPFLRFETDHCVKMLGDSKPLTTPTHASEGVSKFTIRGEDNLTAPQKIDSIDVMANRAPYEKEKTASAIRSMLAKLNRLAVPYAWFRMIPNPTAVCLLADILSAYSGQIQEHPVVWDGNELVLEYKALASRFQVSARTVSRAVELLVKRGLLCRTLKDRLVKGKTQRNSVGVIPNTPALARLRGKPLGDILSAPRKDSNTPAQSGRNAAVTDSPEADLVPLSDFQESLCRAYKNDFEEVLDLPYRASHDQEHADRVAVAGLSIPQERGAGRPFLSWSQQYLAALKRKAEDVYGNVREATFDRQGYVRLRYTLQSFVEWAKTDELLPNGYRRRILK